MVHGLADDQDWNASENDTDVVSDDQVSLNEAKERGDDEVIITNAQHLLNAAKERSAEYTTSAAALRGMKITAGQDAIDAYRFCQLYEPTSRFLGSLTPNVLIMIATTGVDGKYELKNVPPGEYYLYAFVRTKTLSVDWLVPITANGADLNVDLDNHNAISLFVR